MSLCTITTELKINHTIMYERSGAGTVGKRVGCMVASGQRDGYM